MIDLPVEKFKFLTSLLHAIYKFSFNLNESHTMREIMHTTGYSEPQLRSMKDWLVETGILKPDGKRRSDRIGGGRAWVETFEISKAAIAYFMFIQWDTSPLYELGDEWINRHDIIEDMKDFRKK